MDLCPLGTNISCEILVYMKVTNISQTNISCSRVFKMQMYTNAFVSTDAFKQELKRIINTLIPAAFLFHSLH